MLKEITTTYLEMNSPEEFKLKEGFIQKVKLLEVENEEYINMMLFCGVGLPWQWYSRLKWSEEQWNQYFTEFKSNLYLGLQGNKIIGYVELTHHKDNSIEIMFFGLFPQMIGSGLGGMLLSHAIRQAWSFQPDRIWVHTCSLDGPGALQNYLSRGFSIYKEIVEQEDVPSREELIQLISEYYIRYVKKYSSFHD